jgi:hypothetical protein
MSSFDVQNVLKECLNDIGTEFSGLRDVIATNYPADLNYEAEVDSFKEHLQPLFMQIIKKDDSIFTVPRFFLRGIDFSELMQTDNDRIKEKLWTHIRILLVCSYLGADIMTTVKGLISKFTGKEPSTEVDEILKEDKTQSGIEELLETLKDTRIFKLGMEVMENLNVEKLGLSEVDFSNMEELISMVKNPEHPVTKKAISAVQNLIEQKMRMGSLRREDFIGEVEMLKEKFKHSIGRLVGQEFFGDTNDRPTHAAQTILSNHPDARRARMVARLQRKLNK